MSASQQVCLSCGANVAPGLQSCWLCGAKIAASAPLPILEEAPAERQTSSPPLASSLPAPSSPFDDPSPSSPAPASHAHPDASFSLASLLLAMTIVAVMCGLIAVQPGLGIPICIVLAPVLVRTTMVVRRRKEAGRSVSPAEKVALIGGSFLVSCVILTIVAVASVGTFCGVCLGMAAASNTSHNNEGMLWVFFVVAGLAATVATLSALYHIQRWVRVRYRRDVGDSTTDLADARISQLASVGAAAARRHGRAALYGMLAAILVAAMIFAAAMGVFYGMPIGPEMASSIGSFMMLAGALAFMLTFALVKRHDAQKEP